MSTTITHEPLQKIRERRKHISHTLTSEEKAKIVLDVCDRIARGEHLTAISEGQEMPHSNTIRNWIDADPKLRKAYRRAQVIRSEIVSESVITLADEPPPTYRDANGHERIDPAGVQLRRLRIMARQWFATAHLRRWKAESESGADLEPEQEQDPNSEPKKFIGPLSIDEIPFKTFQYTRNIEYRALVRQAEIEGCTPRDLWERTYHFNAYDPITDTWRTSPPQNGPRHP